MAIKDFKHKGLKNLFYKGTTVGIKADHVKKMTFILDAIDASHYPRDLKALYRENFGEKSGFGKGVYSSRVNGNWRITFQIQEEGASFLNYDDYDDYHGKQIKAR
jgi:proteic killer suppression protein